MTELAVDVIADLDVLEQGPLNSFADVYRFDFRSWITPTRRPPGWMFSPI